MTALTTAYLPLSLTRSMDQACSFIRSDKSTTWRSYPLCHPSLRSIGLYIRSLIGKPSRSRFLVSHSIYAGMWIADEMLAILHKPTFMREVR